MAYAAGAAWLSRGTVLGTFHLVVCDMARWNNIWSVKQPFLVRNALSVVPDGMYIRF